jgi:transcriptional regulator with XRE-family HTH domain
MVRAVSDDEQFAAEFQRQVNCRRLVKRLFAIRSARGISRHALARHIGCSPCRIAKIEDGTDGDVSIAELVRYLHAFDLELCLAIVPSQSQHPGSKVAGAGLEPARE